MLIDGEAAIGEVKNNFVPCCNKSLQGFVIVPVAIESTWVRDKPYPALNRLACLCECGNSMNRNIEAVSYSLVSHIFIANLTAILADDGKRFPGGYAQRNAGKAGRSAPG